MDPQYRSGKSGIRLGGSDFVILFQKQVDFKLNVPKEGDGTYRHVLMGIRSTAGQEISFFPACWPGMWIPSGGNAVEGSPTGGSRGAMTKRNLAGLMEWLRPSGIGLVTFLAYALGRDAVARFHILGPWVVVVIHVRHRGLRIAGVGRGGLGEDRLRRQPGLPNSIGLGQCRPGPDRLKYQLVDVARPPLTPRPPFHNLDLSAHEYF